MASRKPVVMVSPQLGQVQPGDTIGARATAIGSTSSPTTTSAVFVQIPEMTLSLTTSGGDLRIDFDCTFQIAQITDDMNYALYVDAVQVPGSVREFTAGLSITLGLLTINSKGPCSVHALLTGLAAGAHTVEARWAAVSGAARANLTQRRITAIEMF